MRIEIVRNSFSLAAHIIRTMVALPIIATIIIVAGVIDFIDSVKKGSTNNG